MWILWIVILLNYANWDSLHRKNNCFAIEILGLSSLPSVSLFNVTTVQEKQTNKQKQQRQKKKKHGPTALNLETLPEWLKKNRAGRTWLSDHLLGPSKEKNSRITAYVLQLLYWPIKLSWNMMKQSHCF